LNKISRLQSRRRHGGRPLLHLWLKLEQQLADPFGGMALFAQQAKDNLLAIKAQQPLVGHLVPYIPHSQAKEYEVEVNPVNGWLEMLADV
jgi:hypothetical protein